MFRTQSTFFLAALALFGWHTMAAGAAPEKPVRVLSVTGLESPAHDWRARSEAIRAILEADPRFAVHLAEDPELLASPALGKYDVLFLHFRNLEPLAHGDAVKPSLAAYVHAGGGLVAVHGALGAFPDWPEYVRIVGRIWSAKTGHDPRGTFPVMIRDPQHPVTRGLGQFVADDELFSGLVGDTPVRVLATAASKRAGEEVAIAFALGYGRGRVFGSTLGHDARAIRMAGTADLLRRACLWAAGRDPDKDAPPRSDSAAKNTAAKGEAGGGKVARP